jgi:hypothetical protein
VLDRDLRGGDVVERLGVRTLGHRDSSHDRIAAPRPPRPVDGRRCHADERELPPACLCVDRNSHVIDTPRGTALS